MMPASQTREDSHELATLTRRAAIGGVMASLVPSQAWSAVPAGDIRAVAFDAFTILDPRPIGELAKFLISEKGEQLAAAWAAKLFASTWFVTAAGRYESFATLADQSLRFTADALNITISDVDHAKLLNAYVQMPAWPDVEETLRPLRARGIKLVVLSNVGEAILESSLQRTNLRRYFDGVLSTDRVRQFKPAPAAYQMAMDVLALPLEQIGFAAAAGWDAVGASWFGYSTAWINRLGLPAEQLNASPAVTSAGLDGVLTLTGIR